MEIKTMNKEKMLENFKQNFRNVTKARQELSIEQMIEMYERLSDDNKLIGRMALTWAIAYYNDCYSNEINCKTFVTPFLLSE